MVRRLHHATFPPDQALSDLVLDNLFRHPAGVHLVAHEDDRVVGFVASLHGDRGRARILTLHVDEAWRGRGVGLALLGELEARLRARRARRVALEVHVDNTAARRLYQRAGYRLKRVEEHAYPKLDPPTGHVLEKRIEGP